jgi:chemotaxis protein methyltransferase CheR
MVGIDTTTDMSLGKEDLRFIAKILHETTGIVIREHKQAMARGRLARRVKALGLGSIQEYCAHLRSTRGRDELPELINALTTNHTAFFRERHHFDYMAETMLPEVFARRGDGRGRLRIWCTASSTGEEPYSIAAMLAAEPEIRSIDARILATDIDSDVIAKASAATYSKETIDRSPPELKRLLKTEPGPTPLELIIGQPLRQFLTFRQLNLIEPWPMKGPLDAIFCRNVFIYFDSETKAALIDRYVALLRPGGWLFLGHSESLPKAHPALELIGRTVYRRLR